MITVTWPVMLQHMASRLGKEASLLRLIFCHACMLQPYYN